MIIDEKTISSISTMKKLVTMYGTMSYLKLSFLAYRNYLNWIKFTCMSIDKNHLNYYQFSTIYGYRRDELSQWKVQNPMKPNTPRGPIDNTQSSIERISNNILFISKSSTIFPDVFPDVLPLLFLMHVPDSILSV